MKRKIILFSFFLFALMICFPPGSIYAKDEFTKKIGNVQVEYGIKGYIRVNSIFKINFKFKNIKKDFKGKIEIRYYSVDNTPCSFIKEVELNLNEDKEVSFYPYTPASQPKFLMLIVDEYGNRIWEKESEIDYFEMDSKSDIVIGEVDGAGSYLSFQGENSFNIKRIALKSKEFVKNFKGLKPIDILIVPNHFFEGKNKEGIEIIEERIRRGGMVIRENEAKTLDLFKVFLSKEDTEDWLWRVEKVVGNILKTLSVKSGVYIVVLSIYIILVGPILYFILLKKRRRDMYLILIPIFSLIFTFFIYLVGLNGRISGLSINYVSFLDLREGKSYENTIFTVTNSTNRSYDVNVTNGYSVEPAFGMNSKAENAEPLSGRIKRKMFRDLYKTDITIGEGTAFETVYFKAEGRPSLQFENMGIVDRSGAAIKGEFYNKTGVDLENVFVIFDNEMIHLGSVKKDDTKFIDSEKEKVFLMDYSDWFEESGFLKEAFKLLPDSEKNNKESLMQVLLPKIAVRQYKEPVFLAMTKQKIRGEFSSLINADDGYTIVMASGKTNSYKDPFAFVNSMNRLSYKIEGEVDHFLNPHFLSKGRVVVTYTLPREDFNKICILRKYNPLINPYTISVKNLVSGGFDQVFSPDAYFLDRIISSVKSDNLKLVDASKLDDLRFIGLKKYTQDGKITIKYEIAQKDYEIISTYMIPFVPKLSLE